MDYGDGDDNKKVDRRMRAQVFWGLAFLYAGFFAGLYLWLR
jgi:hypothetical protein